MNMTIRCRSRKTNTLFYCTLFN